MKTALETKTAELAFLQSLADKPPKEVARRVGNRYGGVGMSPVFDRLARQAVTLELETIDLESVDQARAKVAGALAALDSLRAQLSN